MSGELSGPRKYGYRSHGYTSHSNSSHGYTSHSNSSHGYSEPPRPSRAALGAAEGVSEVIKVVEGEGGLEALGLEDDKEEYLYTAFYKSEQLSARVALSVCLSVC